MKKKYEYKERSQKLKAIASKTYTAFRNTAQAHSTEEPNVNIDGPQQSIKTEQQKTHQDHTTDRTSRHLHNFFKNIIISKNQQNSGTPRMKLCSKPHKKCKKILRKKKKGNNTTNL